MENSSFSKLLGSRLFTFTVGIDEKNTKDIFIHSGVIATHSAPISAMMNGDMHEAKMGRAHIPVEMETFERFCEYVYFGGYTDPPPEEIGPEAEDDAVSPEVVEENGAPPEVAEDSLDPPVYEDPPLDDWPSPVSRKHKKKKHGSVFAEFEDESQHQVSGKAQVHIEFTQKTYDTRENNFIGYPMQPWVLDERNGMEDYCPQFFDHARLYFFADQWEIPPLKELVLHKLHALLKTASQTEQNLGNILDLATLVFENTPTNEDKLRYLIVLYVVGNIDQFKSHPRFDQVISEGGDFACLVVTKMYQAMQ